MSESKSSPAFNPLIVLIFGAVCISFAPVFVKLVGESRLGPTPIGFWRVLSGSVILFIVAALRGSNLVLSRRLFGFAALAGFIFFVDLFVWHRSIIYCGAGMSTVLGNTQVFMTAVFSFFIFKERLSVRFWIAALSAMGGVALLVGLFADEVVFDTRYLKGIAFGLATGVVYSQYLITLRWAGSREAAPNIMVLIAWVSLFAAMFLGGSAVIEQVPIMPPDAASWLWLLSLGLVAQAIGWWVISWSLAQIATARAGLILLIQPTLAMVWGVLLFSEQFTLTQAIGAAMTLTAIYFGGLKTERKLSRFKP
jgi:drug/metabolite transporter (DMT)-like permease